MKKVILLLAVVGLFSSFDAMAQKKKKKDEKMHGSTRHGSKDNKEIITVWVKKILNSKHEIRNLKIVSNFYICIYNRYLKRG